MKRRSSALWLSLTLACCSPGGAGPAAPGTSGTTAPAASNTSELSELFRQAWSQGGLTVREVDDDTFLRRASLDLLGRIPSSAELLEFRADSRDGKRSRKVSQLLDDPAHADHLARKWEQILLGPEVKLKLVDRGAMRRWLAAQFAADVPWNEIVQKLVTAEGLTSLGGSIKESVGQSDSERWTAEKAANVNGAANYFLRHQKAPQDLAGHVSKTFLGVQIQCAQCHDHKTEAWTQTQFQEFSAAFVRVRARPVERGRQEFAVFELENLDRPSRRASRNEELQEIVQTSPKALDGSPLTEGNPRAALATWMTNSENRWFSKALVNRVWADLHGAGFVEPIDDFREKNPPVLPQVLDYLADDFERNKFDLDALYETIMLGPTYANAIDGTVTPRESLFAASDLTPLSSDALLDSIFTATDAAKQLEDQGEQRANTLKTLLRQRMEFVFDTDAESNGEPQSTTLTQSLFLANSALVTASTAHSEEGVLAKLLASSKSDEAIITELYRRTLTRDPSVDELREDLSFIAQDRSKAPVRFEGISGEKGKAKREARADNTILRALRPDESSAKARAFEDLFWALINSNEFLFRR